MGFELSVRVKRLPPYLFVEIDKAKRKARAEGRDIIDLGIGDPDEASPKEVVDGTWFRCVRFTLLDDRSILSQKRQLWGGGFPLPLFLCTFSSPFPIPQSYNIMS